MSEGAVWFSDSSQRADITCMEHVLTCTLAFHILVTCTFLSAVTPRQYFLTRLLMQIFCSISDVYIPRKEKKKKKSSEVVQTAPTAVLTNTCLVQAVFNI